jgi:peptide chain release factor 2
MGIDYKQLERLKRKAGLLLSRFSQAQLQQKIKALEEKTLSEDFWQRVEAKSVMRSLGELREDLASGEKLQGLLNELETAEFVVEDEGENESYLEQLEEIMERLARVVKEGELKEYLNGKYDLGGAIFNVHAGQGGVEAMDWASMLARAYTRYFERKGWAYKLISQSRGEEAGIKAVSYEVTGKYVYGLLKHEAGTHRLVRLSPFNADNLRQTSFALVEVLPIIDENDKEIELNENDLSWHFSRAGGAGGQNVNKVNTAVELTYLPLNLVVKCREERSQEQNKGRAKQILRAKLALLKEEQQAQEIKDLKGDKIQASWGTQIRNYVLHPYQLVKDVRTGIETNDTEGVLDGKLDEFISGVLAKLSR